MLTQLSIQNFGLIDRVNIEFDPHLNILTGETGAGKSILIDALRACLGERLDASFIRNPKEPCFIEAVIEINDPKLRTHEALTEFLNGDEQNLIIQRTLSAEGKNKIKINGMSVTQSQLKNVGNHLIDFHGPHDHQMLLNEDNHLTLLDTLVDFKNTLKDYSGKYLEYSQIRRQLSSLDELNQTRHRDLDILKFQVKELEAVPILSDAKYEELQSEQVKINNAAKLKDLIQGTLGFLDDDEHGANTLLRKSFTPLKNLSHIDEAASKHLEQLSTVQEQLNDLVTQLQDYAERLNIDDERISEIIDLCDKYADIKRKFGPTLEDALKVYAQAKEKLQLLENFEHNDQEIRQRLSKCEKEIGAIATKITSARKKSAQDLKKTIEIELKELGINHVQFDVRFEQISFHANGSDKVTFYISPNAGEELKPLAEIVSSGEAARVMLALKKALIKVDPIPVLIFDEIDAQIGGRLGTITGKKLKEISKYRQVILITHLPQIASFADKHFKVIKEVKSSRALTNVILLTAKEQVEEIAQMMSGKDTNTIAISHARDMLSTAQRND